MTKPVLLYNPDGSVKEIDPVTGLELKKAKNIPIYGDIPDYQKTVSGLYYPEFEAQESYLGTRKQVGADEFDFPIYSTSDPIEERAQRQTRIGSIGRGIGRLIGTTATKFITGAGYVAGLAGIFNSALRDPNKDWLEGASQNFLATFGEQAEEWVKESLPVYHRKEYTEGSIWNALISREFWADEFVDALAFTLSAYIPGGVFAKIGLGTKAVNLGARFAKGIYAGEKYGVNLAKIARNMDVVNAAAYASLSESMFEAQETRNRLKEYVKQGKKDGTIDPDANWDQVIADEAAKTFTYNMAILSLSNLVEANFLFRKFKPHIKQGWVEEGDKLVRKNLTGINRIKESLAGKTLSAVGLGVATQGVYEEGLQFEVQKAVEDDFKYIVREDELLARPGISFNEIQGILGRAFKYDDIDKQKAVAIGSILGLGGGLVGSVRKRKAEEKELKSATSELEDGEKGLTNINNLFKTTENKRTKWGKAEDANVKIIETMGADNKYTETSRSDITDEEFAEDAKKYGFEGKDSYEHTDPDFVLDPETNRREEDEKKVSEFVRNTAVISELQDQFELAEEKGDKTRAELAFKKAIGKAALAYMNVGKLDYFMARLERLSSMSPENAKFMGFNPLDSDPQERMAEIRSYVDQLVNVKESIDRGLLPKSNKTKDIQNYVKRKKALLELGNHILATREVLKNEKADLAHMTDINNMDNAQMNTILELTAERDALLSDYEYAIRSKSPSDISLYNEYESRINKVNAELTKAKKEYNETAENKITEELTSLDNTFGQTSPGYKKQQAKVSELQVALDGLDKMWSNIFDPVNGDSYFTKIEEDYKSITDIYKETLPLNEAVTEGAYKRYEERKVKRDRLFNKVNNFRRDYLNELIPKLINEVEPVDIVDEVEKSEYSITPDNFELFQDKLTEQKNILTEAALMSEADGVDVLAPEQKTQIDANVKALERLIANEDYVVDKDLDRTYPEGEDNIRRDIAEQYFGKSDNIFSSFTKNPDYFDVDAIESQKKTLEYLKSVLSKRGLEEKAFLSKRKSILRKYPELYDKASEKRDLLSEIDVQIEVLNDLLKETIKNRESKLIYDKVLTKTTYKTKIDVLLPAITEDVKSTMGIPDKELDVLKNFNPEEDLNEEEIWTVIGAYESVVSVINKTADDIKSGLNEELNVIKSGQIAEMLANPVIANNTFFKNIATSYENNIRQIYDRLLGLIASGISDIQLKYAFREIEGNRDLYKLREAVDRSSEENKEDLISLIENVKSIVSLENIIEEINAEYVSGSMITDKVFNYRREAATERKHVLTEKEEKTPNNQQLRVIRYLEQFYFTKINPENVWKNIIQVTGEAGTGKTLVVARTFAKLLGLDNIYTASVDKAKDLIATSLDSEEHSIEDLINALKDDSVQENDIIILDEYQAVGSQLIDVFVEYRKFIERGGTTKLILLGDPNQVGRSNNYTKENANNDTVLAEELDVLINNIRSTETLSTVFRTPVGAITEFADQFKNRIDNPRKKKFTTRVSTFTPESTPSLPVGVTGKQENIENSIYNIVQNSINVAGNNIVRRLIVVNDNNIDRYTERFKGEIANGTVRVVDYRDILGRPADEVYIDLPIASQIELNKALYTAVSRSERFVFIGGLNINPVLDQQISEVAKHIGEEVGTIRKQFLLNRDKEIDALSSIFEDTEEEKADEDTPHTDVTPEKGEVIKEGEGDTRSEVNTVDEETEEGVVGTATTEDDVAPIRRRLAKGIHNLAHSTYTAFRSKILGKDEVQHRPIQDGDEVIYIRNVYRDKDNIPKLRVLILSPTMSSDHPGETLYLELGVMGEKDLEAFDPDSLLYRTASDYIYGGVEKDDNAIELIEKGEKRYKYDPENTKGFLDIPSSAVITKGTVKGDETKKLTYVYSPNYVKLNVSDLFQKWLHIANTEEKWIDLENEQATENNMYIEVFNNKTADEYNAKYPTDRVKPGRPYVIIPNPRQKGRIKEHAVGDAIIKLSPRLYDLTKDIERLSPLVTFNDNYQLNIVGDDIVGAFVVNRNELEQKGDLVNYGFVNLLQKFEDIVRLNLPTFDSDAVFDYRHVAFRRLIRTLSNYSQFGDLQEVKDIFTEEIFVGFTPKDIDAIESMVFSKDLLPMLTNLARVMDDKVYKKQTKNGSYVLNKFERWIRGTLSTGEASLVWNMIARGNLAPTDIIIRKQNKDKNGVLKSNEGMPLLYSGQKRTGDKDLIGAYRERVKNRLERKALKAKRESGEAEAITKEEERAIRKESNRQSNLAMRFPSTEELVSIFQFNERGESVVSESSNGLRVTLNAGASRKGYFPAKLLDLVDDNFLGIQPTRIVVNISDFRGAQETISPEVERHSTSEKKANKELPDSEKGQMENDIMDILDESMVKGNAEENDLNNPLSKDQLFQKAKRYIPDITEDQLKLLDRANMMKMFGAVWGKFVNDTIYLESRPDNTSYETILRHEVMHPIWHYFLTQKERDRLTQMWAEENTVDTTGLTQAELDSHVQDYLANRFMLLKQEPRAIKGWLYRLLRKIAEFFGFVSSYPKSIDDFFRLVERGYYSKRHPGSDIHVNESMVKIKEDHQSTDNYRAAEKIVRSIFNKYYNNTNVTRNQSGEIVGLPKTPKEVFGMLLDSLESRRLALSKKSEENLTDNERLALVVSVNLTKKDADGNYRVFDELLGAMYPSLAVRENDQLYDDFEDDVEDATDTTLKQQLMETWAVNYEGQSTLTLKDYIASFVRDGVAIDQRFVYLKYLEAISGLSLNDVSIAELKRKSETADPETAYIFNKALELRSNSTRIKDSVLKKDVPTNMGFLDLDTFIVSKDKSFNIFNVRAVQRVGDDYHFFMRDVADPIVNHATVIKRDDDSVVFFDNIVNNDVYLAEFDRLSKGETFEDRELIKHRYISGLYNIRKDDKTLQELFSHFGSLYKSNPYIGYRVWKFNKGKLKMPGMVYDYLPAKEQGLYAVLRSKFRSRLAEDMENDVRAIKGGSDNIYNAISKAKNNKQKEKVFNDFLIKYKFINPSDKIEIKGIDKIFRDLKGLYDSINKNYNTITNIEEVQATDEGGETSEKTKKMDVMDILLDSESRLDNMSEVLVELEHHIRPTVAIDVHGNTRYLYIKDSPATRIINNIVEGRKMPFLDSVFLKRNILNPASPDRLVRSSIIKLIEDAGSTYKGYNARPRMYENEDLMGQIERQFLYQFMDLGKKERGEYYAQSFWALGDKNRTLSAILNILNEAEIKEGIKSILLQEAERPDPNEVEGLDVDNYTENYQKTFFHNVFKGRLSENQVTQANIDKVFNYFNERSEVLLDEIVDNITSFRLHRDVSDFISNLNKKGHKLSSEPFSVKLEDKQVGILSQARYNAMKRNNPEDFKTYNDAIRDYYRPLVRLFYHNNYVNGYFLNQLVTSDIAFYKDNSDVIKRISLYFSPGDKVEHGAMHMPKGYKTVVLEDIRRFIAEPEIRDIARLTGINVDSTDSQVYILPEAFEERARNIGKNITLDLTIKSAYAGIDEGGIPREIKSATIVMTDELTNASPVLKDLRQKMRDNFVDEAVFHTAFKVGAPNTLVSYNNETKLFNPITDKSIVDLSLEYWKIQFNPAQSIEKLVKNLNQSIYIMNNSGLNTVEANHMFEILGKLVDQYTNKFQREFGIKGNDVTTLKLDRIRDLVLEQLANTTGNETAYNFLVAKNRLEEPIIPLDSDLVLEKLTRQIGSMVSSSTIESLRIKGGHFVLQAETDMINSRTGKPLPPLQMYDEDGYMEVILPDIYRDYNIKEGDVGFSSRIPNSGMQMNRPFKVVDFYPAGKDINIIIAPSAIVYYQDSDYDVDELHLTRFDSFGSPLTLYEVNDKGILSKPIIHISGNDIVLDINGRPTYKVIEDIIASNHAIDQVGKEYMDGLRGAYATALKNELVRTWMNITLDEKNKDAVLSPMAFDRILGAFKEAETPSIKQLHQTYRKEKKTKHKGDLADALDGSQTAYDIKSARMLKGRYNIIYKGLSYIWQTSKGDPEVREDWNIEVYDNKGETSVIYDGLRRNEVVSNGKGELIDYKVKREVADSEGNISIEERVVPFAETMELYIVGAIDNIKMKALIPLNNNFVTSYMYAAGTAKGMRLELLDLMANQYGIKEISKKGYVVDSVLHEAKEKIRQRIIEVAGDQYNSVKVDNALSEFKLRESTLKKNFRKKLDELDMQGLILQLHLIDMYETKLKPLGDKIVSTGQYLSILKDLPNTFEMIQKKLYYLSTLFSTTKNVKDESGNIVTHKFNQDDYANIKDNYTQNESFGIPNFQPLSNDYIRNATKVLLMQYAIMKRLQRRNDEDIQRFAKKVVSELSSRFSYDTFRFSKDTNENNMAIRNELWKALMTIVKFRMGDINIDLDTSKETPFLYAKKGIERIVEGTEAWSQRFIEEVDNVKNNEVYGANKFIGNIATHQSDAKYWFMRFGSIRGATPSEIADLQDGFERLAENDNFSQLQADFIKYSILTTGLKFSSTNFNSVYDPMVFEDFYKEFNNLIETHLPLMDVEATGNTLNNLFDRFITSIVISNIQSVPQVSMTKEDVKKHQKNGYETITTIAKDPETGKDIPGRERIYYDIRVPKANEKSTYQNHPLFIKSIGYEVFVRLPIETKDYVYYQIFATAPYHSYHNLNEDVLYNGWRLFEHVDPYRQTIPALTIEGNKAIISTYDKGISMRKGDKILLRRHSDIYRDDLLDVEVTEIDTFQDRKEIKFNLIGNGVPTIIAKDTLAPPMRVVESKEKDVIEEVEEQRISSEQMEHYFEEKKERLTEVFRKAGMPVEVIEDNTLAVNATVAPNAETDGVTIRVNRNRVRQDTLIHEFGHIYVEMLGVDNPIIQKGLEQVRNTELWKETQETYPEYDDLRLAKEVLVSAIGVEGVGIFKESQLPAFQRWLKSLWRGIKEFFGITESAAKQLARQMITGNLAQNITGRLLDEYQQRGDPVGDLEKIQDGITVDEENDTYTDANGNVFERLTRFVIDKFSKFKSMKDKIEEVAKQNYERDIEHRPEIANKFTLEEYVDRQVRLETRFLTRGKIAHAYMEYFIASESRKEEIRAKIEQLKNDNKDVELNLAGLNYLTDKYNLVRILEKMGLRYKYIDNDGEIQSYNINEADKVITEAKFTSEYFGLGTTFDIFSVDIDGNISVFDYKTGRIYEDTLSTLKYGDMQHNLGDNPTGRAALELMFRVLMYKQQNPNAHFKDISLVYLDARDLATVHEVDVEGNLYVLEKYFQENEPKMHKEMKEQELFDARLYGGMGGTVLDVAKEGGNMSTDEYKSLLIRKMNFILNKAKGPELDRQYGNSGKTNAQIIAELQEEYLTMEKYTQLVAAKDGEVYLKEKEDAYHKEDMSIVKRWLGTLFDARSKAMQAWARMFYRHKGEFREKTIDLNEEFDDVMKPIARSLGWSGLKRKGVIPNNINKLFGWGLVYKTKIKEDGTEQTKYWLVTEKDDEWGGLTEQQKKLIIHIRTNMQEAYSRIMSEEIIETGFRGEKQTKAQALGLPDRLENDFFPIVQIEIDELAERKTLGMLSGAALKERMNNIALSFIDKEYYKKDQIFGQQIRLAHMGLNTEGGENYTKSLERGYKVFMKALLEKEHMDAVVTIGTALKVWYDNRTNEKEGDFRNSSGFVESAITQLIYNQNKQTKFSRKPLGIPVGGGKKIYINPDKLILGMKGWTTKTVMWLNLPSALFNDTLITLQVHLKGLEGSIAKWWGVPPEEIDVSMSKIIAADLDWLNMQKDWMLGNMKENKLYNLARRLDYLTSNYDYKIRKEDFTFDKNKLWDSSMMFYFYRIGEDYGNYVLLAAQLRMIKNKTTGKSMWDSYDNKGKWIGGKRGVRKEYDRKTKGFVYKDIYGLTPEEVMRLKRVSQRIFGGYRPEERVALEQYALGKLMLQFRKYLPQIFSNMIQMRFQDQSLGYWRLTEEVANGEKVYEWQDRTNEGRLWVFLKSMYAHSIYAATLGKKGARNDYIWRNMKPEQKQIVINSLITTAFAVGMLLASGQVPDEDKKTLTYIRLEKLFFEDLAQGWNPFEFLRAMETSAFALPRLFQISNAFHDFMFDGVIGGTRTQKGTIPGAAVLRKYTPILTIPVGWDKYFGKVYSESYLSSIVEWDLDTFLPQRAK